MQHISMDDLAVLSDDDDNVNDALSGGSGHNLEGHRARSQYIQRHFWINCFLNISHLPKKKSNAFLFLVQFQFI